MTSVGIMSMQRIFNYGSSLQAYGLKRLIEDLRHDARVSFIDYEPGRPIGAVARPGDTRTSGVGRTLAKIREYNATDAPLVDKVRFFRHKWRYASAYFPQLELPVHASRDLDVDVQVIGSDEVFNCVQANTNVGYSRDLFGHNSPARRVVSYAASFGNTTLERIEAAGIRSELEEDLGRFAAISVRDGNSAEIVEALTGERPTVNVDPVLAYDFMSRESRIPKSRPVRDKYVIVYGYSGRFTTPENRQIRDYARAIGARVLSFGGVQESADRFVDCGPLELLAYFRDAEAVVTDTFHGTIFSIINNVRFATLVRPTIEQGHGNEEKLGFLLESLGLTERRLRDASDLGGLLETSIDFGPVNQLLERERTRSAEYLSRVI